MNGRDKREDWGRTSGEMGFQAMGSEAWKVWKGGRGVLGWLTGIYGVLALVGMVALEYWAERLWVFSLLLFAPPLVMLIPLLPPSSKALHAMWPAAQTCPVLTTK